MIVRHFDTLTRLFSTRLSRRSALRSGAVASALGVMSLDLATAQEATPAADSSMEHASFLFVQTASSGSFQLNPDAGSPAASGTPAPMSGAAYLLTLVDHYGGTIYFSDRPERIVGETPTQPLLDDLGFTPSDPPNAALVMQTSEGKQEVLMLELVDAVFDADTQTLTYGATILSDYQGEALQHLAMQEQAIEAPATFGRASLFIDSGDVCVHIGFFYFCP